jgi:hypothetical protein
MEAFKKRMKMIKTIIISLGGFLFTGMAYSAENMQIDTVVSAESIYLSASLPVSYTRGYEETSNEAASGEEVLFTVDERIVLRVDDASANARAKIAFTPLASIKDQQPRPYNFDLSSDYFLYSTLRVQFITSQGVNSRSCEVWVLDGVLGESMKNQIVTSLSVQGVNFQRYENYISISCNQGKTVQ